MKRALRDALGGDAEFYKMTLISTEYELSYFSLYSDQMVDLPEADWTNNGKQASEESLWKMCALSDSVVSETYNLTADAALAVKDGKLTIIYAETSDDEVTGVTRLFIPTDDAGLVTIVKSGEVEATLTLERGRRHSAVYHTPYMDFEIRLLATKLKSTVAPGVGGEIELDYVLEIKGTAAHRTVMKITLEPECAGAPSEA